MEGNADCEESREKGLVRRTKNKGLPCLEEESNEGNKEGKTTKSDEQKENDLVNKGTNTKLEIKLRKTTYTQRSRTSHKLKTRSFKRPTYCEICEGLLWGFSEQVA